MVTDCVLRWFSSVSLVLLALYAAWSLSAMPLITSRLPLAPYSGTAYILGYLVLPVTVGAVCEVTSIVTLVVSV
jgi:hypothetical protein